MEVNYVSVYFMDRKINIQVQLRALLEVKLLKIFLFKLITLLFTNNFSG